VPVLPVADVNTPDVVDAIARHEPELIVVVGWTRLIRRPLLAVPPRGCVGFHASLLPENRGRAPVNWAILRGEKVTGNTMMMLDPGTDTGDIIDQRAIAIGLDDTCATVYERVGRAGADMLRQHLPALLTGTAPRRPQYGPSGPPLPRRTPEMGVLDWSWSAAQVHDWVRALTCPYPGAFTALSGRRVMVWRTRPPVGGGSGAPGTVLAFEDEAGIRVATGHDGSVVVDALGDPGAFTSLGGDRVMVWRTRPPTGNGSGVPGTILAVENGPGICVATGGGSVVVTRLGTPDEPEMAAAKWCRAAGVGIGARFDEVSPDVAAWARGMGPRPVAVTR